MAPVQPSQSTTPGIEIRPYQGTDSDLAAVTHIRNETLQATTLSEDYVSFTQAAMKAYYGQSGLSLDGNAWLLFQDGEAVGATILFPASTFRDAQPGNFHLYVVPALWRKGLGSILLDHLEYQALARSYPVLETTIAAEDSRSAHFLAERGFVVVGHSHHLARDIDETSLATPLPVGYEIRSLDDLGAGPEMYVETNNRLAAYDTGYSLIDGQNLLSLEERGIFQTASVFLLFDPSGRVVGLIRASLRPGTQRAYLNEVRLEPASRGKGLGSTLVATALNYLRGQGANRVELDTTGENIAAYNLAARSGFVEVRHWLHFLKRLQTSPAAQETVA